MVPTSCAVTVTEQLPLTSVQLVELKVSPFTPVSDEVKETVPAGVVAPEPAVSATVTEIVLDWPTTTVAGEGVTVVEVLRPFTTWVSTQEVLEL